MEDVKDSVGLKTQKNCPFCGEEILEAAKKCKHCNEWLEKDLEESLNKENKNKEEDEEFTFLERLIASSVFLLISWLLYYFGSWSLVLGKKIDTSLLQVLDFLQTGVITKNDLILESEGILFRINKGYYGFVRNNHFFDSPFIQWIMLFASIGIMLMAIWILIFGNIED